MKKNKFLSLLLIMAVVAFTSMTTGCKKEQQPDQRKPISVMVKTIGLLEAPMTKSFDINQWVYNYNPNVYELKFTGSKGNVYTFNKTIQELQAGFSISVLPQDFVVTYESIHNPITANAPLDDKLDIVINESKTISTSGDIFLNAKNSDYLVIFECSLGNPAIWYLDPLNNTTNNLSFFNSPEPQNQTYKYMYWNLEGDVKITYGSYEKTIPNAQKGNVYHLVSTTNGNTGINISAMNYQMIGW